jgi:hypothetical protein
MKNLKINAVTLMNLQSDSIHYSDVMRGGVDRFTTIKRKMYNLNYDQDGTFFEPFFSSSEFSYLTEDDLDRLDVRSWNAQAGYKITNRLHVLGRYTYYEESDSLNNHSVTDVLTGGVSYFVPTSAGKDCLKLQLNYNRVWERATPEKRNDMLVFLVQLSF